MLGVFSVALVLGALTSTLSLWIVGGLLRPVPLDVRDAVVMAWALVALARDLNVVTFDLPQNARQIPREVFDRGLAGAALRFGFELGTGVRTYVPATTPYVLAALILLQAETLSPALLAGIGFGLGRALMPALRYLSRGGEQWDSRMLRRLAWVVPASSLAGVFFVVSLTFG